MATQRLNLPVALLAVAMAATAAMILVLTSGFTFLQDTWDFLIARQELSVDSLLTPHNEHLVAVPALITWVQIELFGMSNALPEYLILIAFLLGTAGLFYVYVERRVGPWLALFATLLLLGFGPGWEALLWPFEITFVGPVFFGIAALLALEREDRRGDLAACAFLVLGLGFSGLGVPFAVGAAAAILVGRREDWLRRSYVVVVPAVLFILWYLGWGREAQTFLTVENVLESPRFVAEAIASVTGALVGLGTDPITGVTDPIWGRALLVALVVVLLLRHLRRPILSPGLWPVAAAAAANWTLMAFNAAPGRAPFSSRYLWVGAVFLLMILANLVRDTEPSRRTLAVLGALTILALGPNLVVLAQGRNTLEMQSILTQADTAAIEIARDSVEPDFQLTPDIAGTPTLVNVYAGPYLEAVDEHDSPAYTESELLEAPDYARRYVDLIVSQALPLSTILERGAYSPAGGGGTCVEVSGPRQVGIAIDPGSSTQIEVPSGPAADVKLRRFATGEFPVSTVDAPGGSRLILKVPRDHSPRPWRLRVEAPQGARVCPA